MLHGLKGIAEAYAKAAAVRKRLAKHTYLHTRATAKFWVLRPFFQNANRPVHFVQPLRKTLPHFSSRFILHAPEPFSLFLVLPTSCGPRILLGTFLQ
ncbi:hypothetical protein NPIL_598671 [Nephila pilipes]|uniref:Uncharacterized protein n=1 Tax=Nephila pilipes TaxID=299642 RepID=A0A8X6TAZ2_NEPPI|nr:hypothetical protein NPIL_598671 [Nephila pilipes]